MAASFRCLIPYGYGSIDCVIPRDRVQSILEPRRFPDRRPPEVTIRGALRNPIGAQPLREMVKGKSHILIITSDTTRPVPSQLTLPLLLEEIETGNPSAGYTLIVATGLHSPPSQEELVARFGESLLGSLNVVLHEASNRQELTSVGRLSTGLDLWTNRLVAESDLIIAEGFIEPHFFAGFTGGRKSILPGIAGYESILQNHSPEKIDHPLSRNGILEGNPIHAEMCEAARAARLAFILNVVLDRNKEVVSAFAGDPFLAHEEGVGFVRAHAMVHASPADIVITSNGGYPLDRNLYQLVKGISVGAQTAKPGGVVIILGECRDGVGHQEFFNMMAKSDGPSDVLKRIRSGQVSGKDQWEVQVLARVLERNPVIIVSREIDSEVVKDMHMNHARDIQEALEMAFRMKGKDAMVTILPHGPATIVMNA
ncbi:MAG TPA: nickel-dependent lactate racemase [Firmicutes bacterium]|nr:nickel-dependent lactate racemase [Bacillota bacterium]